jgi:Xaa-Pro aminopeptidase
MKSDIDQLMRERNLDALLITGRAQHNPAMVYFTGVAHVTMADLIKRVGHDPILFHPAMEREEAARTGLKTNNYANYPMAELMRLADRDLHLAKVMRYERMFADAGLTQGRVAIYGEVEIGEIFSIFNLLQKRNPSLELVGYQEDDIILQAMATKSVEELENIRAMGERTTKVVSAVQEFLSGHQVMNTVLVKDDGQPLTIGDVKAKINLWLAELGAENPESTIFAMGRDGAFPHSAGTDHELLQLGVPIVFDIFPCEVGGGYFYDFTRTWCLGYAPPEVEKLYQDVREVYDKVVSELKIHQTLKHYHLRTCELFQALGHATVQENPETESGYVHSLGHGVGLHVHEKPFSGAYAKDTETLEIGSVFTIEPGLYYPDRGMGVRLEDTYYVATDGCVQCFVPYPHDLVIPMWKT